MTIGLEQQGVERYIKITEEIIEIRKTFSHWLRLHEKDRELSKKLRGREDAEASL